MELYTITFEKCIPQETRRKIAKDFESFHWEVERKWISADSFSGNLDIESLDITCWDSYCPPVPSLPEGCLLKKP